MATRTWRDRLARWLRRTLVVGIVLLALLAGVGATYFGVPHHGTDWSRTQVERADGVTIRSTGDGLVLWPTDGQPTAGLVFYPGGRVHPDAYLHSLAPLARAGVAVAIPKVRLNLAVLEGSAATDPIERYDGIDRWYVGGHSLGGVMACRYARGHAGTVDGVVLLASYCDRSIANRSLAALSVTGGEDAVLDRSAYRDARSNLPADATVVELDGLNHSQFGAYHGQRGGHPSPISYREAHDRLADVLVPWFENRTAPS